MDLSHSYLMTMEAALGRLEEARRQEIVAEISGHFEDKARWLMLHGLTEEASMEKAMEALGDPAEVGRELKQVHGGATRRDALLAALPPVLLGLSIAISLLLRAPLSRLVIGGPTRIHYSPGIITGGMMVCIGALVLAALILVIGGVVAVARRLPLWGYTWVGTAVMVIVFALMVAADDLPYLVSPVIDVLIMMALLLLLGAALGAVGWRGPLLGGLAGLSTTMILSLVVVSWASNPPINRLDVGLLVGPLGLIYGGLIYGFVTGPPARRAALLAVGGLLCLGTMWGIEYGVFWPWRLSHGQTGQPLILLAVGLAILAFGPAVGLVAQRLRPRAA
ncbi:MAG: permease prefix domain 1-containing protein [Anaerolineae bacterium]